MKRSDLVCPGYVAVVNELHGLEAGLLLKAVLDHYLGRWCVAYLDELKYNQLRITIKEERTTWKNIVSQNRTRMVQLNKITIPFWCDIILAWSTNFLLARYCPRAALHSIGW